MGLPGKQGVVGVTGTTGAIGATGTTGPAGPTGNIKVAVQDTTISRDIWNLRSDVIKAVVSFSPTITEAGIEVFLKNTDGSFSKLPCDIDDTFSLSYQYAGLKIVNKPIIEVLIVNKKGNSAPFPLSTTFRIVSFSGISTGALKQHAGDLSYNSFKKYFNLK